MLDDAERAVLAETERSLSEDPALRRRFRPGWHGRRSRTRALVGVTTLVLMVALFWLGLAGQAFVVGLLAVAVLLGVGWRPADWVPAILRDA